MADELIEANPLELWQANNALLTGTVVDANGRTFAISDIAVITFSVKRRLIDTAYVFQKACDRIGDGSTGEFTLSLIPTDTDEMSGTYYYDLNLYVVGDFWTLLRGELEMHIPVKTWVAP